MGKQPKKRRISSAQIAALMGTTPAVLRVWESREHDGEPIFHPGMIEWWEGNQISREPGAWRDYKLPDIIIGALMMVMGEVGIASHEARNIARLIVIETLMGRVAVPRDQHKNMTVLQNTGYVVQPGSDGPESVETIDDDMEFIPGHPSLIGLFPAQDPQGPFWAWATLSITTKTLWELLDESAPPPEVNITSTDWFAKSNHCSVTINVASVLKLTRQRAQYANLENLLYYMMFRLVAWHLDDDELARKAEKGFNSGFNFKDSYTAMRASLISNSADSAVE